MSKQYNSTKFRNSRNYTNDILQGETVIILEDIEFCWKKHHIELVIDMWNKEISLKEIARSVKREEDEVFLLLLHLARNKDISQRKTFIWGMKEEKKCFI